MHPTRNAIKYNSVGLFLTDSPGAYPDTENLYFFNRVQSASISVDVARQNVQHIGGEDFLDRKIVSEPSINVQFDYLLTDGHEEKVLGFNTSQKGQSTPTGTIYSNIKEDKSLFMAVGQEQFDLTGYNNRENGYSGTDVIGIGNCYVTDYSISASVGDFAKASVSMVGSNVRHSCEGSGMGGYSWLDSITDMAFLMTQLNGFINLQDGGMIPLGSSERRIYKAGVVNPSLDLINDGSDVVGPIIERDGKEIQLGTGIEFDPIMYKSPVSAIPPGGINVNLKNLNVGGPILSGLREGTCTKGSANIQSFNINLPFDRENLYGFGSMHAYGRKMKYPQVGTISFSLLASAFETGDLRTMFCDDEEYQIEINLNNHCDFTCAPSSEHETFIKYIINNAKFDSYNFNESIGSIATVDCNFSFGVSRNNGFFMSGSFEEYYLALQRKGLVELEQGGLIPV
tara:strand:- start:30047 stop:31411 length:1365 start_codon:yes stop_codon:yes gene_type:complete